MRRSLIIKMLTTCSVLLPFILAGQNLLKNGDAENEKENWEDSRIIINKESPASGTACFEMTHPDGKLVSSEFIPVDGTKPYRISGAFRNAGNAPLKRVYFSLIPFDAEKKQIRANEINLYSQCTETVLTAPCAAEDFVLKIKNGSKWKDSQYGCVAFDVDDSGNLKDLPNRNISNGFGIKSIENKGDYWEVALANTCGKSYPAGTKVREHVAGNNHIYPIIIQDFNTTDEWTKVKAKVSGIAKAGVPREQFWVATAFIKIYVFVESPERGKLLIDDLKFEEVNKAIIP